MDANEFLKKVTPAGQRSRLVPFWNDITKLRQSGCTLEQVCEFLAANGVQMSIAGLSKYIKRREEKGEKADQTPAFGHDQKPLPASPIQGAAEAPQDSEPEVSGLSKQAQRERRAQEFIRPENTNPLLKKLLPKETKK
ncbi:hypothetical protein CAP31_14680 (plasmid) [Sulfuriferula sp. AH1]|uniref:hypothetical protein n=1 Tax=Sulfuriferula sp. AH1 TaxID=1985873 RepID=UPI000B3B0E12|nr:hypothetical protein [Sulfuriferula sp. AH1]ARU33023.1 hypothetical protein CAP31_14680 [Sulfuriferula sp. AH1]